MLRYELIRYLFTDIGVPKAEYINGKIKDVIEVDTLTVQGRTGFIDETKKKVVKLLLKSGLYKALKLKDWLDNLLSEMYTNLQNYK